MESQNFSIEENDNLDLLNQIEELKLNSNLKRIKNI